MEKERKQVVILFADISGFTKISQELDPEELSDVINFCFKNLDAIIIKHGGMIDKHEGDRIMALFGVKEIHEDDIERSVNASLEMLLSIMNLNKELKEKTGKEINLNLHIGINVGEVIFGEVGSEFKKEYTVIGDAVNLASRLCEKAEAGEILVSENIYFYSDYLFEYEEMKPARFKGLEKEVKFFKLIKKREKPLPKRGIKGLYSPVVGRDNEINLLKKAINEGVPLILLIGEAGLGKTRLLNEIKEQLAKVKFFIGNCPSYGENIPYAPFKEIIKKIYEINDYDSEEEVKEKIASKTYAIFSSMPETSEEIIPYIINLFAVKLVEERIKYLEPKDLKLQTFLAIYDLFNRLAEINPTVFVIDDYHWIDEESIELLNFVLSKQTRFTFIISSRPEKNKLEKIKVENKVEIKLEPLTLEASIQLFENLLKLSKIEEELMKNILDKAAGNPLYLEEIIKILIYKGKIIFEDGVWRAIPEVKLELPLTIYEIIGTNINSLPYELKLALQIASVIGVEFDKNLLSYIYQNNAEIVLQKLINHDFIYYLPPNTCYFKHPLIQEVAYNMLLKKRRSELHKKVGDAIKDLYKDKIEKFYSLLSYHYFLAEDWQNSYEYSVKAGEVAQRLYQNYEAIKLYDRAIISAEKANIDIKNIINLFINKVKIFFLIGEVGEATKLLEKAMVMAYEINDKESILACLDNFCTLYINQGKYELAKEKLNEMREILSSMNEINEYLAKYYFHSGLMHDYQSCYDSAYSYYSKSLEFANKIKNKKLESAILNNIGILFYIQGDRESALNYFLSALKIYREEEDKQGESLTLRNTGALYIISGKYKEANECLEEALKITKEIGYKRGEVYVLEALVSTYINLGEFNKAMELINNGIKLSEKIGEKIPLLWLLIRLGEVNYLLACFDLALKYYNMAREIAKSINDFDGYTTCLYYMAKVYIELNKYQEAELILKEAKELAENKNLEKIKINIYLEYINLYLKSNNIKDAEEQIKICLELIKSVKITKPGEASIFLYFGKFYIKKQEKIKAKEYLKKAIDIYKEIGNPFELACSYFYYSKIAEDKDYYLNESKKLFEKIGASAWFDILRKEN